MNIPSWGNGESEQYATAARYSKKCLSWVKLNSSEKILAEELLLARKRADESFGNHDV
jgi:hypothetical protein